MPKFSQVVSRVEAGAQRFCRNPTFKTRLVKYMISLIYGILKKLYKCTYLQNRNRFTDLKKQIYGCQIRNVGWREKLGCWD